MNLDGKKMWLNLHHLYYFFVIVNEGSLTKASETLLVGPPSLSSQIKQLENFLGKELFERKNKKMILTEKGQVVYQYAETIFKVGQDLIDAIHGSRPGHKSQLRVGISENLSKGMVLQLCRNVINEANHVINISSGKTSELMKDMKAKKLDILFTNSATVGNDVENFNQRKISSSPYVICGHKRYLNLSQNFPYSLNRAPFMLSLPESKIRNAMDGFFIKNRINIELIGETKDFTMQRIIATEGLALIVAPLASVQDMLDSKDLIEIGRPENISEDLFLLTPSTAISNSIIRPVFELIQSV